MNKHDFILLVKSTPIINSDPENIFRGNDGKLINQQYVENTSDIWTAVNA